MTKSVSREIVSVPLSKNFSYVRFQFCHAAGICLTAPLWSPGPKYPPPGNCSFFGLNPFLRSPLPPLFPPSPSPPSPESCQHMLVISTTMWIASEYSTKRGPHFFTVVSLGQPPLHPNSTCYHHTFLIYLVAGMVFTMRNNALSSCFNCFGTGYWACLRVWRW